MVSHHHSPQLPLIIAVIQLQLSPVTAINHEYSNPQGFSAGGSQDISISPEAPIQREARSISSYLTWQISSEKEILAPQANTGNYLQSQTAKLCRETPKTFYQDFVSITFQYTSWLSQLPY